MDYGELRHHESSHGSHRDRDRLLQNESNILFIKTTSRNIDHMANKFSTINTTNNCKATYYSVQKFSQMNQPNNAHSDGEHRRRQDDYKMEASHLMDANNNESHPNQSQTSNNNPTIGYYELKKTLGKGNFSTVKLAQHKRTGHLVAIKVVKTSVLNEDNLLKVHREIDVLKKLEKHPHIVRLYQVVKTKRYLMLVTEYCSNGELYEYLVDKGKLSEAKSCDYFLQVLSAVEYLHKHNVVHRDLKAENLLLTEDYTTIKIADFGFANYFTKDKLLDTWCGSPPYAAPELFKGEQYIGPSADIWSLGVILYVMVCGSLPFDGSNLLDLKRRVLSGKFRSPIFMSFECENLVRQILRLKPEKRLSISQIKAHHWVIKYSKNKNDENNPKQSSNFAASNSNNSNSHSKMLGEDIEKNRGKSLDLEDVKQNINAPKNEDTSMLCLNEGDKLTTQKKKPSQIKSLVDDEMANAVSNMSLDSNNSSMSVSQSQDTNTLSNLSGVSATCKSRTSNRPDSAHSCSRNLSKESSIDDQIIDFMMNDLEVADKESSIRDSISQRRFDDLHAIYRLLHDQPKMMFDSQAAAEFKIPYLPVLPVDKQHDPSRPSITRGFIDVSRISESKGPQLAERAHNHINFEHSRHLSLRDNEGDDRPINLVTQSSLTKDNSNNRSNNHWNIPPQLFLTPPIESRAQHQEEIVITHRKSDCGLEGADSSKVFASGDSRHSFDLTIHQMRHHPTQIDNSTNKLQLSHNQTHELWDSSILDTLVALASANQSGTERIGNSNTQGSQIARNSCINSNDVRPTQVIMPIESQNSTHCNNQAILDQNQLHPHLINPLTISAAVSMTNKQNQEESRAQNVGTIGFKPNNLANQNCNVAPHLATQNLLANSPNLSLLDPNGLNTSLERRASDGLTNYPSLSTDERKPTETASPINLGYNPLSPLQIHPDPSLIDDYKLFAANLRQLEGSSVQFMQNSQDNSHQADKSIEVIQKQPLDLTFKTPGGALFDMARNIALKYHGQSQRRNSTTSETSVFPNLKISNSTSNSPRNSIHVSTTSGYNQGPLSQTSPSSISLTGGGPGHLLNRRKRHSLDTEYRNHYYHHHHHHHHHHNSPHLHHQQHYPFKNFHNSQSPSSAYNTFNIRAAVQMKPTFPQQCPPSASVGRPRNFAQAFTYDNMFDYRVQNKDQTSSTLSSYQSSPNARKADDSSSQDRPGAK